MLEMDCMVKTIGVRPMHHLLMSVQLDVILEDEEGKAMRSMRRDPKFHISG
jgi:hypothetical protein